MLNVNDLLLPAAASPQAVLLSYEELTLLNSADIPADVWRSCAERLRSAKAKVATALAGKYEVAIARCIACALDQEAVYGRREVVSVRRGTVTIPFVFDLGVEMARWAGRS